MPKKSSSSHNELKSGMILLIAGLILGPPIADIMDSPEIIMVAKYDEKIVPRDIVFNTNEDPTASISIELLNSGDSGTVYVGMGSDKLLSRANNMEQFKATSFEKWFVNKQNYQDYSFELNMNESCENVENFTIYLDYGWSEKVYGFDIDGGEKTRAFTYQKLDGYARKYVLV